MLLVVLLLQTKGAPKELIRAERHCESAASELCTHGRTARTNVGRNALDKRRREAAEETRCKAASMSQPRTRQRCTLPGPSCLHVLRMRPSVLDEPSPMMSRVLMTCIGADTVRPHTVDTVAAPTSAAAVGCSAPAIVVKMSLDIWYVDSDTPACGIVEAIVGASPR